MEQASKKPRVLLVDDEERYRTTLAKLLTVQGLSVSSVGSGLEALDELKKGGYDVVLLDVKMPGMDGMTTLAEIKKINRNVEVIMLTGHASVDVAVEIMQLGGYEYLLKPCPVEEILEKVEAAFERKTTREASLKKATPSPNPSS
ncbi:MAG: response regulator [Syntrophobacteraceae bacterium]|nr:response regulator [Syntrophobacteraceae bacterium]